MFGLWLVPHLEFKLEQYIQVDLDPFMVFVHIVLEIKKF